MRTLSAAHVAAVAAARPMGKMASFFLSLLSHTLKEEFTHASVTDLQAG